MLTVSALATEIHARCDRQRHVYAGLRVSLAITAALFDRIDGRRWPSFASQGDYVRGRLGISPGQFLRYKRLGCFLLHCPQLHEAVLGSRISFSVADRLALGCDPDTAVALLPRLCGLTVRQAEAVLEEHLVESERGTTSTDCSPTPESERGTDPTYERVSFAVPAPIAQYIDQSLALASAHLGADLSDADCVDAVVAEASTEITPTVGTAEARRRFQARRRQRPRPAVGAPAFTTPLPHPRFHASDRHAALVLDRRLSRLLARANHHQTDLEDFLLELQAEDAASLCGYAVFADFVHDMLDIPRSTLFDYLQRARQRRRGDPVAIALADGRLPAVKAQLLDQLARRCHVPWSCLEPWIEQAQTCTTRHLERMLRWATMQRDLDYRAWSNADCRPPTDDQVRTSNPPPHEIAANPEPENLLEAERAPQVTLPWTLQTDCLDVLLQLMAAIQDKHREDRPEALPPWACLLNVFVTARRAWSVLERQPLDYREKVRRRDHYRCVVPHCTQRRNLEVHHLHFRSAQGPDDPENLATFCAFHHQIATHRQQTMRIRGRATNGADDLVFELGRDPDGRPLEVYKGEHRLLTN